MQLVNLSKRLTIIMTIVMSSLFVGLPAQAGMVGTAGLSNLQTTTSVESLVEQRHWIKTQLEANGVAPADAALRVSSLSDRQVQQVHQRIDEMPAGAGALGIIAFGFLVLAITDLTGLTDVFPFIRPVNK